MMKQTFMEISAQACGQVYKAILDNSASHRKCAAVLEKENEFPNAAAHLILATEELLKGLVVLLESKGMQLRKIKGFKKIFTDHKTRHYLLRDLIPVWIVIKKIIDEIEHPTSKKILKPSAPKFLSFIVGALNMVEEGISGYMQYEFWKGADQLKKLAFYVDYEDELLQPKEITKAIYDTVKQNVERVTKEVLAFVQVIENSTPEETEAFIMRTMDEDFRDQLEKIISGKHSIFDA